MKYDARIIQKQHGQPAARRALWGSVTALFWLGYLYLWLPVVTLAMWLLGVNNAFVQLYLRKGTIDTYLLVSLPLIALVCSGLLFLWSGYNRIRFAGLERRSAPQPVALEAVAQALGADATTAAQLRASKWVTLVMNDDAQPIGIIDHAQPPPSAATDDAIAPGRVDATREAETPA